MKAVMVAAMVGVVLSACQTRTVYKEVRVPLVTKCNPAIPQAPTYAGDVLALEPKPDVFQLAQAFAVEREQRKARETELLAAAKACSDAP